MTTPAHPAAVPARGWGWWRGRSAFVLVSVLATALDIFMTFPPAVTRGGHYLVMWNSVDVTASAAVAGMAAVWLTLLLGRRRWPLLALVGISLASVVMATSTDWAQPVGAVLVCLYTAARVLTFGPALVALITGIVPLVAGPIIWDSGSQPVGYVLSVLLMASVAMGVWLFGRREHEAWVTATGLRHELEALGQEVATRERQRIARELHDILAHSVSAMMMQAAGAGALVRKVGESGPPDPRLRSVGDALSTIEGTGAQSMRELHRLLSALREDGDGSPDPETPGEGEPQPGIGDIDQLVELTRQSGLVVQVHRSGERVELDPSVRLAGYRVAQESLANAMKHAGRGAVVDIFKSWQPDRLQLQVRSRGGHDGTRPGTPGSGTGLVGLRERVELVGGTFEAGWVGEEFVTTAVLPLTAPSAAPPNGGGGLRADDPPGNAGPLRSALGWTPTGGFPARSARPARPDPGRPTPMRPVGGRTSDGAA